jgi:hypothetical protein
MLHASSCVDGPCVVQPRPHGAHHEINLLGICGSVLHLPIVAALRHRIGERASSSTGHQPDWPPPVVFMLHHLAPARVPAPAQPICSMNTTDPRPQTQLVQPPGVRQAVLLAVDEELDRAAAQSSQKAMQRSVMKPIESLPFTCPTIRLTSSLKPKGREPGVYLYRTMHTYVSCRGSTPLQSPNPSPLTGWSGLASGPKPSAK